MNNSTPKDVLARVHEAEHDLRNDPPNVTTIMRAIVALHDAAVEIEKLRAPNKTIEQRTLQPMVGRTITADVALNEAERCRRYPDRVLNEAVIVILADEVLRLRTFGGNER